MGKKDSKIHKSIKFGTPHSTAVRVAESMTAYCKKKKPSPRLCYTHVTSGYRVSEVASVDLYSKYY